MQEEITPKEPVRLEENISSSEWTSPLEPSGKKQEILEKINALEQSGEYFEAASLARVHKYSDKALENYQKAAEKYRELVHSKEKLVGEKIRFPREHKVKMGGYEATVRLVKTEINATEIIPKLKMKIRGKGIKVSRGYFLEELSTKLNSDSTSRFDYSKRNEVIESTVTKLVQRHHAKINQKLLELKAKLSF